MPWAGQQDQSHQQRRTSLFLVLTGPFLSLADFSNLDDSCILQDGTLPLVISDLPAFISPFSDFLNLWTIVL